MLRFQELMERKLGDVGSPGQKVKDFEKDAHSQGIDLGPAHKDAHHINYPKATFRRGGKPAKKADGTAIGGDLDGKGKFHSQKHTHGNTLRDAVKASGRVDKRPAAKAKRKEEATLNKAKKAKNRDPFTREHTEWWIMMHRLEEMSPPASQVGKDRVAKQKQQNQINKDAKTAKPGAPLGGEKQTITQSRSQRKAPRVDKYTTDLVASKKKEKEEKKAVGPSKPAQPQAQLKTRPDQEKGKVIANRRKAEADFERKIKKSQPKEVKAKTPEPKEVKAKKPLVDPQKTINKRKRGIGSGVKSALGGDNFMRAKKGDSNRTKATIAQQNRANRAETAKNAVGSAASAAGSALKRGLTLDRETGGASEGQAQGTGTVRSYGKN